MADLLRELEDDLRHQRLMQFWRKFGSYMIGVSAIIVLVTIGMVFWGNYREGQQAEAAEIYARALKEMEEGKLEESRNSLNEVVDKGQGYSLLAQLQLGNLAFSRKEWAIALEHYRAVGKGDKADSPMQHLATVLEAKTLLAAGDKEAFRQLTEKPEKAGFYAPFLRELRALYLLEEGDKAGAASLFQKNAEDALSPLALRERSLQLAESLTPGEKAGKTVPADTSQAIVAEEVETENSGEKDAASPAEMEIPTSSDTTPTAPASPEKLPTSSEEDGKNGTPSTETP
jgi:hypothetical protein